jgi:hypothetical protein
MAYSPPPKFYPPVELDEATGRYELTQPWNVWFLNLGRNLGLEQTATGMLGTRLTAVEGEVDVLQAASAAGFTGTVTLAKITVLGANGSLTVVNGLITAVTAPT